MGFTWKDGRSLTDLIDEMNAELLQQTSEPAAIVQERVDWSSVRNVRVQGALLKLISELGEPNRAEVQAEVAHLPDLARRIPRFLEWSRRQGWVKAIRPDDQGYRYVVTDAGTVVMGHAAVLPPGSTRLDTR